MAVYIHLLHGRKTYDEQLTDWGTDGPVLGPFAYVHTTYAHHIKLGDINGNMHMLDLYVIDDLVYYDGILYGDWSVFDGAGLLEDGFTPEPYDAAKARTPGTYHHDKGLS